MMLDLPQPFGPTTPVRLLGKLDRGRIDEGFESGELDLGQAQMAMNPVVVESCRPARMAASTAGSVE